jgi:hypothetical protein
VVGRRRRRPCAGVAQPLQQGRGDLPPGTRAEVRLPDGSVRHADPGHHDFTVLERKVP